MFRMLTVATLVAGLMLTSGCMTMMDKERDDADHKEMEDTLNRFCQVPDTDADHVLRARLFLAAATGYAYRNIEEFSSAADANNDAVAVLQHVRSTIEAVDRSEKQVGHAIFPVYRADNIVSLARLGAVGTQPALRAGRSLVGALNAGQIQAARSFLKAILANALYGQSYERACSLIKEGAQKQAEADANQRIELRCSQLRSFLKPPAPNVPPASKLDTAALLKACGAPQTP